VRHSSVVSLSWVLEQAFITNNFGDTVTCVIPTESGLANPRVGDRNTAAGTFRFFTMPARLVGERAGALEDVQDLRFNYPRATPEKALLDWIYLGASAHSRMTRPPMDLDLASLNQPRLKRLVKRMHLAAQYESWMDRHRAYQADADVRENSSADLRL
jgi:hypothetical protein